MDKIKHALRHNPEIFLQDVVDVLIDGDGLSPERLVKDVRSMVKKFLSRKDKRPFCPDCGEVMVKCHRNDVDDGWRTSWLCVCKYAGKDV